MIASIEETLFRHRGIVLGLVALFTLAAIGFCARLTLDTSVENHLPADHEYMRTFLDYQEELLGTDRVLVVVRARQGDIWNVASLRKLRQVTDTLAATPGIDRRTVTSLWTPDVSYMEITEEGLHTEGIIGSGYTVDTLDEEEVQRIRQRVRYGGLHGRLVASDDTAALVVGSTADTLAGSGEEIDRLELAARLESALRRELSDDNFEIHLVGVPTMMADIAAGAQRAFTLLLPLALLLTLLLLFAWTGCWRLSLLVAGCSGLSLIWQFGLTGLLGWGFDPLLAVFPFLVFAVGVAHGFAQTGVIAQCMAEGDDAMTAARKCFRGLLLPGSITLAATAAALLLAAVIPVHTVRALGIAAAFGVGSKIISNLVLLPLLASYEGVSGGASRGAARQQRLGAELAGAFGALARRGPALATLGTCALLVAVAAPLAGDRHYGDEHPGANELLPGSRYNADANLFTGRFEHRMDLLLLIVEVPPESCIDYGVIDYVDRLSWHMENVPGVHSVMSATPVARYLTAMWNEGNPKWSGIPRNRYALMQAMSSVPAALGAFNEDCSVMMVQVFTDDHAQDTVETATEAARRFREQNPSDRINLRLASGGIAVQAATNEVLRAAERPMLTWLFVAVILLALLGWRAAPACCVPPLLGTLLGYALMAGLGVGVTTATLPALVLAIGFGSMFSFFLWDRLRLELARSMDLPAAWRETLEQVGGAVACMALSLTLGSAVWWLSTLTQQAEVGCLLALLLPVHALLALTVLPASAALLGTAAVRGTGSGT